MQSPGTPVVRLAELVAALSYGADLGLGQPLEHCLRQTVIAQRLAALVGAGEAEVDATYYLGLLMNTYCNADAAEQALIVKYTIVNQGASARRLAPWEITRVAPGGLTFYASDSAPTGDRKPATMTAAGCVWIEHGASVPGPVWRWDLGAAGAPVPVAQGPATPSWR